MSNIKLPAVFNPDEDDDYSAWESNAEICQVLTKEKPMVQHPSVYLSLRVGLTRCSSRLDGS